MHSASQMQLERLFSCTKCPDQRVSDILEKTRIQQAQPVTSRVVEDASCCSVAGNPARPVLPAEPRLRFLPKTVEPIPLVVQPVPGLLADAGILLFLCLTCQPW